MAGMVTIFRSLLTISFSFVNLSSVSFIASAHHSVKSLSLSWTSRRLVMNALAELLQRPLAEQVEHGYAHTAREIAQQPDTWVDTARAAVGNRAMLREVLRAA